jgi:hypothetical protein
MGVFVVPLSPWCIAGVDNPLQWYCSGHLTGGYFLNDWRMFGGYPVALRRCG